MFPCILGFDFYWFRFLDIMMPNKVEDELEVLREGANLQDPSIDNELRKLLDETKDLIDR